jgi:hypothetical protein
MLQCVIHPFVLASQKAGIGSWKSSARTCSKPRAKRVVEIEDARLFFPEDRPDELAAPVLKFWDEWSQD